MENVRRSINEKTMLHLLSFKSLLLLLVGYCIFLSMRDFEVVERALDLTDVQGSGGRLEMIYTAINDVFDSVKNFAIGKGPGTYYYFDETTDYFYPHNFILDLAVSCGVPAAVTFCYVVYKSCKICWVRAMAGFVELSDRLLCAQVLGLGIVTIIGGLLSFSFASNLLLFLFIGISGSIEIYIPMQHKSFAKLN